MKLEAYKKAIGAQYVHLRPKHTELRKIEGWYETGPRVPDALKEAYSQWLLIPVSKRPKFTRWLLREKLIDAATSEVVADSMKSDKFKISCRHSDFLRMGESKYYKSCLSVNSMFSRKEQIERYLADPDTCLIYIPDNAGHIKWRIIGRLVIVHRMYMLLVSRAYGTGNSLGVLESIQKNVLPVCVANTLMNYQGDVYWTSATRISNEKLKMSYFDHLFNIVDGMMVGQCSYLKDTMYT